MQRQLVPWKPRAGWTLLPQGSTVFNVHQPHVHGTGVECFPCSRKLICVSCSSCILVKQVASILVHRGVNFLLQYLFTEKAKYVHMRERERVSKISCLLVYSTGVCSIQSLFELKLRLSHSVRIFLASGRDPTSWAVAHIHNVHPGMDIRTKTWVHALCYSIWASQAAV